MQFPPNLKQSCMRSDNFLFKLLEFYGTRLHHKGQWRVHERLQWLLGANVDVEREVVRNGRRFVLNPSDFVQRNFFWFGEEDRNEPRLLARLLTPDSVIFDVGANFGYYSITLADALGERCRVFAFEPFPSTFSRLRHHIELNGLHEIIKAFPIALADKPGGALMKIDSRNTGAASFSDTGGDQPVKVSTLDSFCSENAIDRIDLLKVDVEGTEERFLIGGAATISRLTPLIFIELNPATLVRGGTTVDRLVSRLKEHGYELFIANRDRLEPLRELPRTYVNGTGGPENYLNAFCLHPSRRSSYDALLGAADR